MTAARSVSCFAFVLAIAPSACACHRSAEPESEDILPVLTLAIQGAPYSGLIAVAEARNLFRQAGLTVRVDTHPSGRDALSAMLRGEAEVATVADIAFASAMETDPSLRVFAAIGATMGSEIVARKDRGLHAPADLRGRKVGTSPGTSSHYFLHSFLLMRHLSLSDVETVAVAPTRQVEAVVAGEVDAVSALEVYAFTAKQKLGENAVAWDAQNSVEYQWLLAYRPDPTNAPEKPRRLLRALVAAEDFTVNHPAEAQSIIAGHWNLDPDFVRSSWSRTHLFVGLNQSVVTALQTYSKWHRNQTGGPGPAVDVLHFVDSRPLTDLDPRSVTVFQ